MWGKPSNKRKNYTYGRWPWKSNDNYTICIAAKKANLDSIV